MNSQLAPVKHSMVTGTVKDLRTVKAVLARLRPCCPRCERVDVIPLTWCETVIWFQCARCYKLWHEDVDKAAVVPVRVTTKSAA
jgi:hypothetical protein